MAEPQPEKPAKDGSSFLQRPIAIVTLVGGVIGIIAASIGLFGGDDGDGPSASSGSDATQRIEECVLRHGLPSGVERRDPAPERVIFRSCSWPPPPGANPDGFSEITVASRDGPGESEAEGLTVADVLTSACDQIEARYLFDDQGTFVPEQPVHITKGEVRRVEGGSIWFPGDSFEAEQFAPGRDESVILSNSRYSIDTATCI